MAIAPSVRPFPRRLWCRLCSSSVLHSLIRQLVSSRSSARSRVSRREASRFRIPHLSPNLTNLPNGRRTRLGPFPAALSEVSLAATPTPRPTWMLRCPSALGSPGRPHAASRRHVQCKRSLVSHLGSQAHEANQVRARGLALVVGLHAGFVLWGREWGRVSVCRGIYFFLTFNMCGLFVICGRAPAPHTTATGNRY